MKLPDGKRIDAGRAVLGGESATVVASRYGVSVDQVARCATEVLEMAPGYSPRDYLVELRKPGQGRIKAAVAYFRQLGSPPTPRDD